MLNVLVTGANGFIGGNLCIHLQNQENTVLKTHTKEDSVASLEEKLKDINVIYHLAGANRPVSNDDFAHINKGFTEQLLTLIEKTGQKPKIIFASSTQAVLDNPYGSSKLAAEKLLSEFSERMDVPVYIYRLTNVFGKWCRPNYNSVVATFCHNIARDIDIQVNNPDAELKLAYIDDVIADFLKHLNPTMDKGVQLLETGTTFKATLEKLADTLQSFKEMRQTLILPNYADTLTRYLYTTYLSYLPIDNFSYKPLARADNRGSLVELLKSESFGQIFVSSTHPGITRGNHYHHTKVEKFCVVSGEGVIRFRQIESKEILEYPVSGTDIEIVDIPPGYTHNIENTGTTEMIVLFWANEVFNQDFPDTYYVEV